MQLARVVLDSPPPWLAPGDELRIPVGDGAAEVRAGSADLEHVLEERYHPMGPPLSTRLPFHYHRLPARLRRALAGLLMRGRQPEPFPRSPCEPSLDAIRWARGERINWPEGKTCALLLTHDVDTAAGFARVPEFAGLERGIGVRSAFFLCSHHYGLDLKLLERLEQSGFEIGSHGYDHDNRIAFLDEADRERRLDAIAERFRGRVSLSGFRSPSLGRTPGLYRSLVGRFAYDSSVPDVDLEQGGGCATVLPYRIGELLELPITLPMESSLLYRGVTPTGVFERWSEKLDWIRRVGGVATAVLHTEPQLGGHRELLGLYLRWLAELPEDVWVITPRELVRYLSGGCPAARGATA